KIHHILSTISCHGSLRAGRKLSIQEMNSLLRQMEKSANIAQCCHGRPSYVTLSVKNLNKFFERY
ncbi:MAG: DNA mismatch repair protein MutL, partial [Holosporaceae bacterium]|nr:DNA mismatch repair protein MutL [Holosporaceae bacterium]